ncbi:terpene synthase family protein [Streptomyces jumonjinensis]|uniref:terpene synthase family protein n=1 Tax=Streptomyces jumonjinensis TaxID=1945 RepID=UPI0037B416C6
MLLMHLFPGARYRLPPIPQLLAFGRHPHAAELERRHDQWLRTSCPFATNAGRQRFLSHRSALWTAATFPTTEPVRFHDLSRLTSLLFAFDDLCLDHTDSGVRTAKSSLADCLGVLKGEPPSTEYGQALHGIWDGMGLRMPPGQRDRLIAALTDFAHGCFTEMVSRADQTVPDFPSYVRLRIQQSLAAWIYFILTEYAAAVDLDAESREALDGLHWLSAEHLLFANDLFSFRAEHFGGDHLNAVCVMTAAGASLQNAVDELVRLLSAREHEMAAALATLRADAPPRVLAYLEKLEYVVSGNLAQARFAPRYHGTQDFIDHPIGQGTVTLRPDRTEHSALKQKAE